MEYNFCRFSAAGLGRTFTGMCGVWVQRGLVVACGEMSLFVGQIHCCVVGHADDRNAHIDLLHEIKTISEEYNDHT